MKLSGKVVLVTGGSRGIGRAICVGLAREGAIVAFTYRDREDAALEVKDQIIDEGGEAQCFQMDVRSRKQVEAVFLQTAEQFGQINGLINNAGIYKPIEFDQITDAGFDEMIEINLRGPLICSQTVLPYMQKSDGGSIVNIGGQYSGPRAAHYAASKAGLIALGQVIARFGAKYNIRCNTLAVGLVASEMAAAGMKDVQVQQAKENIMLGRMGTPQEVADGVCFLISEQSSYITAQTINLNGGLYF